MTDDQVSKFMNENQAIINSIALFSALAAFFLDFFKDKEKTFVTGSLLPFVTILIVIFLLIRLFLIIEKMEKPTKSFAVFKALLLVFLSLIIFFIFEYWNNSKTMLFKLIIAFGITSFFLFISKFMIKKGWLLNQYLTAVVSFLYVVITSSIIILLFAPNCIKNDYLTFILTYIVFALTLFMFIVIVYVYTNIFDRFVEIKNVNKKNLGKVIILVAIFTLFAILIAFCLNKLSFMKWLSDIVFWIIKLPTRLICK